MPGEQKSLEQIKAEARLFALSGTTKPKKKSVPAPSRPYAAPPVTAQPSHRGSAPASWTQAKVPLPPRLPQPPPPPSQQPPPQQQPIAPPPSQMPPSPPPDPPPPPSMKKNEDSGGDDLEEDLDDYAKFVKMLGLDLDRGEDHLHALLDDDEDEFQLDPQEDLEDDDDDDDGADSTKSPTIDSATPIGALDAAKTPPPIAIDFVASPLHDLEQETNFYRELEEELGWLEEEDMEAAVATLLDEKVPAPSSTGADASTSPGTSATVADVDKESISKVNETAAPAFASLKSPGATEESTGLTPGSMVSTPAEATSTPLRDVARANHRIAVTPKQYEQLHHLLEKHYQLLMQQAVLAVRAANIQRIRRILPLSDDSNGFIPGVSGGESPDDLVEILDGAVGMLQDLDQNRKDAIRQFIQFEAPIETEATEARGVPSPKRSLLSELGENEQSSSNSAGVGNRRLTRAQFSKTLLEQNNGQTKTIFDIRGLGKLKDTFEMIDKSVQGVQTGNNNILEVEQHGKACEQVFSQIGVPFDKDLVPGSRDVSTNFVDAREYFGPNFKPPCRWSQDLMLRRNRNLFTAGEDNLVLRGVNLYGEKQWMLIADRYLPDRSVNIISQRYSKLCYLLYKAHGIKIDKDGNLVKPPKLESVDDLDEEQVGKLKKVPPPAILNVHRWSVEEDLTLLKAVPLMGSMWAELRARLIPHRDRGHLRKRYQVLERRVKATVSRINKQERNIKHLKTGSPVKIQSMPPRSPHVVTGNGRVVQSPAVAGTAFPAAGRVPLQNRPFVMSPPQHRTVVPASRKSIVQIRYAPPPPPPPPPPPTAPAQTVAAAPSKEANEENEAAAILAQARGALPYPHPSFLYQPPRAYHPYYPQYYPAYHHPGHTDESSRAAFEKLVHEPSHEWSQMSQVQRMIDNETDESMVASTIVTQLAKSPTKPGFCENGVTTAASFPNTNLGDGRTGSSGKEATQSVSFLAGVLERTNSGKDGTGAALKKPSANAKPQALDPMPSPSRVVRGGQITYESSNKRKAPPQSPSDYSGIYPEPRTPIGIPGFRSGLSPSSALNTLGTFPDGASPFLNHHSGYSRDGHSVDFQGVFSSAAAGGNFEDQADSPEKTSRKTSLFGDGATLMENDLDAIAALNSLSHSPAKFSAKETSRGTRTEAEQYGPERKSLYAKVVGGAKKDKEELSRKKRKLKF